LSVQRLSRFASETERVSKETLVDHAGRATNSVKSRFKTRLAMMQTLQLQGRRHPERIAASRRNKEIGNAEYVE
jgi:hypothetical protein